MTFLMFFLMAPPPGEGGAGGSIFSTFLMFAAIIAIFYLMILRPQQKQRKQHQQMIESLKKGDKVILSGGLHGTVAGLEEKTVLVQVAENVKMKFERASVASVLREGEGERKESK